MRAPPQLDWDYADRLQHTLKSNGSNQDTHFTYGADGQRVRKVYEHGGTREERIYLGGYEVYRRSANTPGASPTLERTTLHVMDDQRRVVMVETKTRDDAGTEVGPLNSPRWRYQLENHLGSSGMELDQAAAVISYEEYHPYGSTAFSVRSGSAEVSAKRYRYTGKERDEETGLYYHGARYYAPWLGRWTSADPKESAGLNRYGNVSNMPTIKFDPDGREESSAWNRFVGGLRVIGGAAQAVFLRRLLGNSAILRRTKVEASHRATRPSTAEAARCGRRVTCQAVSPCAPEVGWSS